MQRQALPLDLWPEADQALWQAIIAEGDILEGDGTGAKWAPTTKTNTRKAYGYWLHWLSQHEPGTLAAPPLARLTRARVGRYLESMEDDTAPLTRFSYILDLLRFVQAADSKGDWDWLKRLKNRLFKDVSWQETKRR